MDAGHVEGESQAVNLSQIIEEWLDDLGALPDSPDVKMERDVPPDLYIAGEKRYTSLIVQNLLENARRYNRPGGLIRVTAHRKGSAVLPPTAHTPRPTPPHPQHPLFDRFH